MPNKKKLRIAVIGATGFTGLDLVLILSFLFLVSLFIYFLSGVSFFPAIAIAFPFLVLALQ